MLALAAAASAAPNVITVNPNTGLAAGGTTVTVRGQGFVTGATTVKFGTASATQVTVNSASELTATAPAGTLATAVDVTATTSAGTSAVYRGDTFTYGAATPYGLEVDGTTTTKVAFQWSAPAVAGVTGYTIYRGGTAIGTTDAYTTNYTDSTVAAGTAYTYTVSAQTFSGSTAQSSGLSATAATTAGSTTLSACSSSNLPSGHYILSGNLTTASGDCLKFASVSNVTIDCANNTLTSTGGPALRMTSVSHFFVTRCKFTPTSAGIGTAVASSSSFGTVSNNSFIVPGGVGPYWTGLSADHCANVVIAQNTVTDSEVNYVYGTGLSMHDNTFTVGGQAVLATAIAVEWGSNNTVNRNTMDGAAPIDVHSGNGADDGIVIEDEANDVIANNTIGRVWDMGIETTDLIANTQILNNTIDYADISGIGAFAAFRTSWFNNVVSGNTVSHSGTLSLVRTGQPQSGWTTTWFQYNTFAGNSFLAADLNAYGAFDGIHHLASTFDGSNTSHPADFVGNNSFSNNNFGAINDPPQLASIGTVTDSGNRCTPPDASYTSLACDGTNASTPTVTGVTPTSGSTDGGGQMTISGTGFGSAGTVSIWPAAADARTLHVPNCATVGATQNRCFTVISNSSITLTIPTSAKVMTADVRVTSDVNGTSPPTAADHFTYISPSTPTLAITRPLDGANLQVSANYATFTVSATDGDTASIVDHCTLTDAVSGAVVADQDCSYTYSSGMFWFPTLQLGHPYTVLITAVDKYDNATSATATFTPVDTLPPIVRITAPVNGSTVSLPVAPTFTIAEYGTGVAAITCLLVDTTTSTTVSNAACTTGSTLSGLTAGDTYSLTVSARDGAGNIGTAVSSFTVSTTPTVTVTNPKPASGGIAAPYGVVPATFTTSVPATTTCSWDSAAASACTSGSNSPFLANGTHTLTVVATPTAGGSTFSSGLITFTVDGPTAAISSPVNGSLINTRSVTPAFSGNQSGSSAGFTYTCKLDTAAAAACTSTSPPSYTAVTDGPHTITVVATNSAGYSATAATTFTVDATPPDTVIDSGPGAVTNTRTPAFAFHSTETPATLECAIDTGAYATCTSPFTAASLAAGDHTFYARAKDTAGNYDPQPASYPFKVVVAGTLTSSNATFGSSVNLATQGTLDWAHWGSSSTTPTAMDHKASVTSQIGGLAAVGGGTFARITGVSPTSTWTGGVAPNASSTSTTAATGLSVSGSGKGFSITAAASDTTSRTLRLYIGALNTTATVNLTLTDGSATIANSTFSSTLFTSSRIYTIAYKAGSPGASLKAKVTASNSGKVRLYSATLQ